MNEKTEGHTHTQEGGFISHLIELRDRLLRTVAAIALVLIILMPFARQLYTFLAEPLLKHLPDGGSMIATSVISPFLIPFKLALMLSIFITVPYSLYHVWGFVAPGLYNHEKRLLVPLLFSSTLLFYLGVAFAYWIVFPVIFDFMVAIAPEGITVMPDISSYFDVVMALFLAFGVAFEIPVATVLLVAMGLTTPETLAKKRPHVIVGVFVIGMLLTPPDIISQVMLALPMLLLYEAGIIVSRFVVRDRSGTKDEDPHETET